VPARAHVPYGSLRGDEHGAQVHRQRTIELLKANVIDGCDHGDACIVHQTEIIKRAGPPHGDPDVE
jgi:hypothetical protein